MSKTVLLADDSVTIQKVVGISFANEDVRLVTVDNGDDAVARAREIRPDIVLADVVMPGLSGYEVCEAIKADPALAGVPVLLLSGTFESFDEGRARDAGADGHITKPFEAQALVDAVNQRLAAPPAPAASAPAREPAAAPAPEPALAPAEPALEAADDLDFFDEGLDAHAASSDGGDRPGASSDDDALSTDAYAFDAPDAVHDELSVPFDAPPLRPEPPAPTVQRLDPVLAGAEAEAPLADASEGPRELDPESATTRVDFDFGGGGRERPAEAATHILEDPARPDAGPDRPAEAEDDLFGSAESFEVGLGAPGLDDDLGVEAEPALATPVEGDPDAATSIDLPGPADARAVPAPGTPGALEASGAADAIAEAEAIAEPAAADALVEPDAVEAIAEPGAEARDAAAPRAAEVVPEASPFEAPGPDGPEGFDDDPILDARPLASVAEPEAPAPSAAPGEDPLRAPSVQRAVREMQTALGTTLHETLERAAWEALGDVSARLVEEAVERIEKVAWEVIPGMAEALIREEIQRLKDED